MLVIGSLLFPAAAGAYPPPWSRAAACIVRKESSGHWHIRDWPYAGGFQFLRSTWERFAPSSFPRDPAAASPAQQRLVAWRDWRANGHRWGGRQWPVTSRLCRVK